jgi:hypothetical protein
VNRTLERDMDRKHRRWPLGTPVAANTPAGYLTGIVFKHWRKNETPHGATVLFPEVVDMGDANGARFCHIVPFRNMRKL